MVGPGQYRTVLALSWEFAYWIATAKNMQDTGKKQPLPGRGTDSTSASVCSQPVPSAQTRMQGLLETGGRAGQMHLERGEGLSQDAGPSLGGGA